MKNKKTPLEMFVDALMTGMLGLIFAAVAISMIWVGLTLYERGIDHEAANNPPGTLPSEELPPLYGSLQVPPGVLSEPVTDTEPAEGSR